jgi:hypothetical protein
MQSQDPFERTLCGMPVAELADFPTTGFRARFMSRFERDLGAWLASGDGQFARWQACRLVDEPLRTR